VSADPDPEQLRRRARRAFIRTHHPDAGGDRAAFVAGLADLNAELGSDRKADIRDAQGTAAPETAAPETAVPAVNQPWPVSITTKVLQRLRLRRRKRSSGPR
jgi:hypothetical protein